MKKSKKKVLFTAVVLISAAVISINVGISNQKNELFSLLLMDNIEALAGESGGFDCYLHKDNCQFEITTSASLFKVNNFLKGKGLPLATFGMTVNFTDFTALFSPTPPAPPALPVKVRCGTDVTCAQFIQTL